MKKLFYKIDLLTVVLFIITLFLTLWMLSPVRAQEATPEATAQPPVTEAPPDVVIENPDNVTISPDDSASSDWYPIAVTVIFAIASTVLVIVSRLNSKEKSELGKELSKSVPFEVVMALLGAGVKLTQTETDDKGLEKFKQELGLTKSEE